MLGYARTTDLPELKALHCLVRRGSWIKAAQELGVSRAQLSQTVAQLEQRLGVPLLDRARGEVTLTEAGIAFHSRTGEALDELAKVEAAIQHTSVRPSGKVRLSAPVILGQTYVAPLIGELRRRYPELAVELSLMDRFVDLVHEEVDLALRVGSPFDARLTARRLCRNRRVLVASPQYIERYGAPDRPEQLSDHDCILFTHFANEAQWKLSGPEGLVAVPVSGLLSSNNGYVMNSFAEQGLGVTFGATASLAPSLLNGRLVRVLRDYEMEETGVFAVYLARDELPSRVSAVIDFLAEHFTDPPIWDRQLDGKVLGF